MTGPRMSVCMRSNGVVARRWGSLEICCLDFAGPQDVHSSLVLSVIVICPAFAKACMRSREICPSRLCHSIREAFKSVFSRELSFKVSAEAVVVVNTVSTTIWS